MQRTASNITLAGFSSTISDRQEETEINSAASAQCNPNLHSKDADCPQKRLAGHILNSSGLMHACPLSKESRAQEEKGTWVLLTAQPSAIAEASAWR